MRIAVISDIHGNLDAFKCVLADMTPATVDTVYSLGDNVGYGPQPEEVLALIRHHGIPSVMGNHELALSDPVILRWFNPTARTSLERTRDMLSEVSLATIFDLPTALTAQQCRFVHGFPPDSPTTYLFQVGDSALEQAFSNITERLCFVGHTHELLMISFDGKHLRRHDLAQGVITLDPACRYLINIGSVGQPRDGNNNAKYVIWDTITDCLDIRFVPYDIASVVKKIEVAGLPEAHAKRLW
ncbi:MAG: metallophosphoesterase [Desulfobacterales bacterium]|nr:metallophosphoesterase [Desulfobacterales bacterium]